METPTVTKLLLIRKGSINSSTRLEFAWRKDNRFVAYDSSLNPITEEEFKQEKKTPKSISFPQKKIQEVFFIDSKSKSDMKLLQILNECPHIQSKNNKDSKNAMYELIDVNSKIIENVKIVKKDRDMLLHIDAMTVEEMSNVLNYLGVSTQGMLAEEIYTKLTDFKTGLAYQNYDKIMGMNADHSSSMKININKGIALGVIRYNGGVFMFKENVLGNNNDQIQVYFDNNKDLYVNGFLPELKNEGLPISIGNELDTKKSSKVLEEIAEAEELMSTDSQYTLEYLQEKAKEYNIKGTFNMKFETLKNAVLERERMMAEKAFKKAEAIKES
jgi:hypothetical protein